MRFEFKSLNLPEGVNHEDWFNWTWQMRNTEKNLVEFNSDLKFKAQVTPYYEKLSQEVPAIRKIFAPTIKEFDSGAQQMRDPLGEEDHSPTKRIVHRYTDRVLFLVTDICSVYCRFCTRKYFTGKEQSFIRSNEYENGLNYIREHKEISEVILSGGDPLTLSDNLLFKTLKDLRSIDHVEIIRVGTRMPVVCPMRVDQKLALGLREYGPVFIMSHFNHPKELTAEAAHALSLFVDTGIPVFNQMVLLNGVNNHAAIVQALSRRLLYLRVKPYYMFQCDPSLGTDHLRTCVDESLAIQRELWGKLSGLAMPNLSLDLPGGGGKVGLVPDFMVSQTGDKRSYIGWDGKAGEYVNPPLEQHELPSDYKDYL